MPAHVQDDIRRGWYHGGPLAPEDYDHGHDGWTLQTFVEHDNSHRAKLSETNVLAVRYQVQQARSIPVLEAKQKKKSGFTAKFR
jgi:hypothetical protein